MKPKRILLIAHNFSPELVGMGKYNGEMINWLLSFGLDCTVITTFPYYPYWKVQAPYKNLWYKKETLINSENLNTLRIYRCPSYIPKRPTGKSRSIQDISFFFSKFFVVLNLIITNKRFDYILTVAPPFHLAFLGLLLKKISGGKLVYHIQDMQIEAARDLNLISNNWLLNILFKAEKYILKNANYVSSISRGMIKKIEAKCDRNVLLFPNWVDTSAFYPIENQKEIKISNGYKADDIIFLYSGSVGVKQGLEELIMSAEQLIKYEHIKFIICSSGPYKDLLEQQVLNKKLKNVAFWPVQEKDTFNTFLNMADVHLVIQKANAGDLVMPSKLTTILAVGGVSIITAQKNTSLYDLVEEYDFGYIVEPDNYNLLTEQILAVKLDEAFENKKINARNYALEYLNIDSVMNTFLKSIDLY